MEAVAGVFLALMAFAGIVLVARRQGAERLYWWAGFFPFAMMGAAGAAVSLGVNDGDTSFYMAASTLAAVLGSAGFLLATVNRYLQEIPEMWVNIAFAIVLAIVIATFGTGAMAYAGMLGLVMMLGLVVLAVTRAGHGGAPLIMIGAGAAVIALAPILVPQLAQTVLTGMTPANILFLQTGLGVALIAGGARLDT